jgi:hypothetical protein
LVKRILLDSHLDKEPVLRPDEEMLIFQIQREAFQMVRPFWPKPRLELGTEILGNDSFRGLSRISWTGGIQQMTDQEKWIPLFSRKRGSIFIIIPVYSFINLKHLLTKCHRILLPAGKIAMGFIPRHSSWAKSYTKKVSGPKSLGLASRFYSMGEMEKMMMQAGFALQGIISTLFQGPGNVRKHENPMKGYRSQAGFIVLLGECPTWAI